MRQFFAILTVVLLLATATFAQDSEVKIKKNSWGIGFGIPYGVLGSNADFVVAPNLSLSIGCGTTILAGVAYNAGFKYYLGSYEKSFRPRVSAFYGVNAVEQTSGSFNLSGNKYTGLSVGFGAQWMWGKSHSNGLDFDVIFIASTGMTSAADYSKTKISVGYRRGI